VADGPLASQARVQQPELRETGRALIEPFPHYEPTQRRMSAFFLLLGHFTYHFELFLTVNGEGWLQWIVRWQAFGQYDQIRELLLTVWGDAVCKLTMAPSIEDIEEGKLISYSWVPLLTFTEQLHFANVISTFKNYAQYTVSTLPFRSVQILIYLHSFLPTIAGEKISTRFRNMIKNFWTLWATN